MSDLRISDVSDIIIKILDKLENIERLLIEKSNENAPQSDQWMDISELCRYLPDKPTLPTVYAWVNKKAIPYYKGGSRLRFLKSDIDQWLKEGRRKTMSEIDADARAYIDGKNKK